MSGTLGNGVPVVGLNIAQGQAVLYTVTIPKGATYGEMGLFNATGNADLYVKRGSAPTTSSYDCAPKLATSNELCAMNKPSAGTYYILVRAVTPVAGLTLRALWEPDLPAAPAAIALKNGIPIGGLKVIKGQDALYSLIIPKGATYSEMKITGGSGDADLYVKRGSAPTLASYDCRPRLAGNEELCTASSPKPGKYYIMVHGNTDVSGLTLRAMWLKY